MRISGQGRITIPKPLRDRLGLDCGAEVEITPHDGGVLIRRLDAAGNAVEAALVGGRLRGVDTRRRTAQLHQYGRPGHIPLRFGPDLDAEMRRLETQYVEVRGTGWFDEYDEWASVHVEELNETRSWSEPFDLDAFLNDPNPKIFDPHSVPALDLSDEEWESFLEAIRIGRGSS